MESDTGDSKYCVLIDSCPQTEIFHNFQKEQVLGPSEYLAADPPVMDVNTKSCGVCGLQQTRYEERTHNNIKLEQFEPQESDQHLINASRHLNFGATTAYNITGNDTRNSANSISPEALPHVQITVPYQNEPSRISSSLRTVIPGHSGTSPLTYCHSESFEPTQYNIHNCAVHIPARFGLPFNSVTRSLSMDSDITPFTFVGNQNAQERTQRKDSDGVSNSSASRDLYARLQPDSQASPALGYDNYPIIKTQPLLDSIYFMPYDNPYEVKILTPPNTDNVKELNKASPKRNRKRTKDLTDGEGCQNCNCKRSKCLKLYCECFAAGLYCLDNCACANCFNRPEYEDTVHDIRQQIEIRNPIAFSPKVVKPTTSSPSNSEEASRTKPLSARHKRGCNCKKSKCLKKYCECFQAGVGCYNGCRCEDCNNLFGRKSESIYRRMEKWESPSHEQMDMFEAQTDFIDSRKAISLTPISQDQSKFLHKGSSLLSSTAFNYQYSSDSSTPQLLGRKVLSEFNSDRIFHNVLEEDPIPIPGILGNTSTPLKLMRASSSKQKGASPPQRQSPNMISSSYGSKSIRHFNLPPSPRTPYSQLKTGKPGTGDDIK